MISESAFDATGSGCLRPVSKAEVFREFAASHDPEDVELPAGVADATLALLVEQGMVEVADDTLTVPARFWSSEPAQPEALSEPAQLEGPQAAHEYRR